MAEYDIPDNIFETARSDAFRQFYHYWFEDSFGLNRHEVDLEFLNELTPAERGLAIDLLRLNLRLGCAHIIEGIALLDDNESIPTLKKMLAEMTDASRRLTIAGSLWKLGKDESFPEEIERMVSRGDSLLKEAHLEQILWLRDERSIRFLIDLLEEEDTFASFLALSRLNEIEDNKRYLLSRAEFPHQPDHYIENAGDDAFIQTMVSKMINYSPAIAVMSTVSGIVSKKIQSDVQ
ncbi:MAG: hypothetical protein IT174_17080 [Acidobacteria bacterium]|nr:hypothetical protein [Acidobacteriota bacterium]